jgi:DNA-binding transcriptional LysR family regulator
MLPDLESLRCFEAAARFFNFRTAARTVALSPAAFSARIKALESQLGIELFQRTTRRVTLTAAGVRLLPQARRCLDEARRCADVVASEEAPPFVVRLGTRFELGMSWIVPRLTELHEAHPERTIHLYFGDSPDLLGRLDEGLLDCVVTSFRLVGTDVRYAQLHEERYAFVAAAEVARERPLGGPSDAAKHTLLDAHSDLPLFRYFLDACPPEEVWAFSRVELLGTIAAVRFRALEGAGVAVLPYYFVAQDIAEGRLVRLLPQVEPNRDFFRLVWPSDHPLEPQFQTLAEELRSEPLR